MPKDEEDLSLPWLVEAVNKGEWNGIALPDWHEEGTAPAREDSASEAEPETEPDDESWHPMEMDPNQVTPAELAAMHADHLAHKAGIREGKING